MIDYFLVRERDNFLRIGVETFDYDAVQEYLSTYFASVEFIGEFMDVIYTDIDTEVGLGHRKIPGGTIVTCKYIYQLRTKKEDGDYFEYLRQHHEMLRVAVEETWKRKHASHTKEAK